MNRTALRISENYWTRKLNYRQQRWHLARDTHDTADIKKWGALLAEAKRKQLVRRVEIAEPFIQSWEGWYDHPYDDGTGVQTIGWGFIASDFPNHRVPAHMTRAQGDAMLRHILLTRYAPPVVDATRRFNVSADAFTGLLSFAFNLGTGAYQGSPGFESFQRALKTGTLRDVADTMLLYSNPGDPAVHRGLLRRRTAERRLILK